MEKKELFLDVEKVLELSRNFRKRIEFAETSWLNESDALQLFESQVKICETIRDLVDKEEYLAAFILNRTLLENYLLIYLILKGTKYALRYKVPIESGEKPKEAYDRLAKKLEERKDVVSCKPLKKYKLIEIVHEGLYPEKGDRLIPVYYFVFQEYDPVTHWVGKIKSIASKDFSPDIVTTWQKKHESLYKTYFGFRNLLKAAVLNEIITDEQAERVRVHYNFLSAFTHLTKMSFDLIHSYEAQKNKHCLLELNLLYILSLLRLYLLLLTDFFSKTEHSIKNVNQLVEFLDEQGKKYDYFWFIFDKPSEYDYFAYQTVKAYRRIKGEQLEDKIPYYKNPYQRLKNQHQTIRELSTGLIYISPWSKHDASI